MITQYHTQSYASISVVRCVQAVLSELMSLATNQSPLQSLSKQIGLEYICDQVFLTSSGRGAIALCLQALGIEQEDEVILCSFTCLAVPTAVLSVGATPVYVDIDVNTLSQCPEEVKAAITRKTRAIIIQHTLGMPARAREIISIARENGIAVIEDLALSVGTQHRGEKTGIQGDASIISMELSKTISCGWGGVLLSHSPTLSAKISKIYETLPEKAGFTARRDLLQTLISAVAHSALLYNMVGKYILHLGFVSGAFRRSTPRDELLGLTDDAFIARLPAPLARLAVLQWKRFAQITSACARNAHIVRTALDENGFHVFTVSDDTLSVTTRVPFLVQDRAHAEQYFHAHGIELGRWFDGPLSPNPTTNAFRYRRENHPKASAVADQIANIPCGARIAPNQLRYIVKTIAAYRAMTRNVE